MDRRKKYAQTEKGKAAQARSTAKRKAKATVKAIAPVPDNWDEADPVLVRKRQPLTDDEQFARLVAHAETPGQLEYIRVVERLAAQEGMSVGKMYRTLMFMGNAADVPLFIAEPWCEWLCYLR